MRRRRPAALLAALLLGALLALAPSGAALADPPTGLGGSQLVDRADALTSAQETRARDAIQSYDSASGDDLRVVFVRTFTDPTDRTGWAEAAARASDVSGPAVVLAVAVQAHQYGFARNSAFPLDRDAVQSVADDALPGPFRAGDWAGGVAAFAKGLQAGGGSAGSSSGSAPAASSSSGAGPVIAVLLVVLLVVAAAVVAVVLLARRRRRAAAAAGAGPAPVGGPPVDQAELDRRASRALIRLDDDLTSSEQELGFVVAEFGERAAAPFTEALQRARATAREAFGIRQRLDDDVPETPAQRREMSERIAALCEQAERTLHEQTAAFDDLRKLEQQLPTAVPAARQERDRLSRRAEEGAAALATVRTQYGDEAVRGAADDLAQARDLLAVADRALETAGAPGGGGEAAAALSGGRQALAQAGELLDGLVSAPSDFVAAKRRLDAAVEDVRQDIAEAAGVQRADPALTAAVDGARKALSEAELQAPTPALATVGAANARLDAALAPVRDAAQQRSRAVQVLPRTLDAAEEQVRSTRRFIDTRRGGVGSEARTRITEAQSQLDRAIALQQDDPVQSLGAAQRAQQLANDAYALAQQDVDDFRDGGGPFGGGGYGGYGRGGGFGGGAGGLLGGAVLGGILGGVLSGGGGWGGGGWAGGPGWNGGGWGGDAGGGAGWGGDGGGGWDGGGGDFGGGGDSSGGGGGSF